MLDPGYLLARDRVEELSRGTMCTNYAYLSFVVRREGTILLASPTSLRFFLRGSFGGAEGGKDSVRYDHYMYNPLVREHDVSHVVP